MVILAAFDDFLGIFTVFVAIFVAMLAILVHELATLSDRFDNEMIAGGQALSSRIGVPLGSTEIGRPVPLAYCSDTSTPRCR